MKLTRYCLLVALFIVFSHSFAQVYQVIEWYDVDSLESVLPDQDGKERVNTLYRLAASLCFEDFNKTTQYVNDALLLSENLNYREGVAAATRYLGNAYYYNGEFPKALELCWKSINIYNELEDDYLVARLFLDIVAIHLAARNSEKCLEFCQKSLEKYRQIDNNRHGFNMVNDTMQIYSVAGLAWRYLGRSDTALAIYLTYLDIGEKHNFEITNMMLHNGLAAVCYTETGEYEKAKSFYKIAIDFPEMNMSIIALKHEFKRRLAALYLRDGEVDIALQYLTEAYEWLSQKGFLMQSQRASLELGKTYFSLNQINNAELYFRNSEALLNEMIRKKSWYRHDSLKYTVSYGWELFAPLSKKYMKEYIYNGAVEFYSKMYRYSKERGLTEPYIRYIEAYTQARDTLIEIERKRELIEIHTKFESEQKDNEIQSLSQENELKELEIQQSKLLFFGLIGLMALIGLITLILIRQNQLKNRQRSLVTQQKLLRSQMNPHFIFNSLSSIQHLIMEEEPEKASIYLAKFSTLVRNILDGSAQEYITIENEIKTIESYLALQKIRYLKKFDYTVSVDPKIETESLTIPPMLAQPFIENSIEHGMKHKKETGHIDIRFLLAGDLVIFEVEDDGIGREKASEIKSKQTLNHQSMATSITRDRLKVLNKKLKKKIELRIIDLKNESGKATGTKVVMEVPFEVI